MIEEPGQALVDENPTPRSWPYHPLIEALLGEKVSAAEMSWAKG